MACDTLIFALGQLLEEESAAVFGIKTGNGLLPLKSGSWQTEIDGLFAAGEAVSGGSTIVACMSAGMAAGNEIVKWLQEKKVAGGQHG